MQLVDGAPVYSATDLVGYLACEHLTTLERAVLAGQADRPHREDRELDIIRRRGFEHEARYLNDLRADGRRVVSIERNDDETVASRIERQATETFNAMASGADVIYQATFFDGRWLGYADFLLRVEAPGRPSIWGPYHYEVADTKLARHVKAGAVLQMCSYVDQLQRLQGVAPLAMHVVLGGSARERASLRVDDYMAYYRAARERFEATMLADVVANTYPEPVDHCEVCRWNVQCQARRRTDDHLSLVANITRRQRKTLAGRGIETVVGLAASPIPFDPPLDGTSAASIERVREQARIQVEGRALPHLIHELLVPPRGTAVVPGQGLAALPPPDPGDLFLDLEGDPYAFGDGIDYLLGLLDADGVFTALWARDPKQPDEITLAGEKAAFEHLMDLLIARLDRSPSMHVYHYAAYEPTALKRLMGRHGTREAEVDRLLRGGVLVDLFRVVRQSLRASVESYSIKKLEPLYGFEREIPLQDATSSIVAFEEWLQLADADRPSSAILTEIAGYNRDDVVSTLRLRDWLESLRPELAHRTGAEVPRPALEVAEPGAPLAKHLQRIEQLTARLAADRSADPLEPDALWHARWLLGQLLSWHRREEKGFWWLYFRLKNDLTDEERVEAAEPVGLLEYVGVVNQIKRSAVHRYRFPPQEHDLHSGSSAHDPATGASAGEIVALDDATNTLDLKRATTSTVPHPRSLIPYERYATAGHVDSLVRMAEWVLANGVDTAGDYRAGRDLLLRRPPRLAAGTLAAFDGEDDLARARRLALSLDQTTLAIQGPPGSGKTFTGARMVLDLVRAGRRVGVTATSHKVVSNFLRAVAEAAAETETSLRLAQKCDADDLDELPMIQCLEDNAAARDGLADGEIDVVGGTTWLWTRDEMQGLVDVLVVDEAGQMSLANVLAAAPAGRSLVLLGDPQQLDQPLQGTHPPGADRSALAHLLDGRDAIPDELGIFLEHTWRLHPRLTAFTSGTFYEGRLESRADLGRQLLDAPAPLDGAGPRLVTAHHIGADNESPDEAHQVAQLVRALVESQSTWVDRHGIIWPLTYDQVLIVAPYNAQVGAIQRLLPAEARIGTVDKFQGQEAPVSIYSMTSSSPEDAPRGMQFLYSRHRLNVATSRARCIAIVVAEPALLKVRARTPEQMRLANALCRFAELAPRPLTSLVNAPGIA